MTALSKWPTILWLCKANEQKIFGKEIENSSFSYLFEILHMCCYGQPDTLTNILHIIDLTNKKSAKKEDDDNFPDKKNNFAR